MAWLRQTVAAFCVFVLVPHLAVAGGDARAVKVHEFSRHGSLAASFRVVMVPGPGDAEPFPGGCRQLEVEATYAWWKWWWKAPHQVTRQAQERALDVLEKAARDGTSMQFGYMGSGWVAPDARQPCRVVSHAVVELPDDRLKATAPSVYSFYKAP
jgi:hypothetical protein